MEIADQFAISQLGLVLSPSLTMPRDPTWQDFSATIWVITPTGESKEFKADFKTHLNYNSTINVEATQWQITVVLPAAKPESVPIGSKIRCRDHVKKALGISTR